MPVARYSSQRVTGTLDSEIDRGALSHTLNLSPHPIGPCRAALSGHGSESPCRALVLLQGRILAAHCVDVGNVVLGVTP